jgi:uncharacterized protein YndB with AHSA1/START domain
MATESKARIATTQVYEVYIKASPQAIWNAITSPEWTVKYGYQGAVEYELRPGGAYRAYATPEMQAMGMPDVVVDGVVEKVAAGFSRLTVIHELEGAPIMAAMVASKFSEQGTGGWAWILSDMKSLLETGRSM